MRLIQRISSILFFSLELYAVTPDFTLTSSDDIRDGIIYLSPGSGAIAEIDHLEITFTPKSMYLSDLESAVLWIAKKNKETVFRLEVEPKRVLKMGRDDMFGVIVDSQFYGFRQQGSGRAKIKSYYIDFDNWEKALAVVNNLKGPNSASSLEEE